MSGFMLMLNKWASFNVAEVGGKELAVFIF